MGRPASLAADGLPEVPEAEELFSEDALAGLRSEASIATVVQELRQREEEISALAGRTGAADVARLCLAPTAMELEEAGLPMPAVALGEPASLFQAVCELPFSPATADVRRHARETSRVGMLLQQGDLHVPACVEDFRELWELAMQGEPRWSETYPTSAFRTGEVTLRGPWPEREILHVCMDAGRVPGWLGRLVTILVDEGLPVEVRAGCGLCLHDWIHPFVDGNGHTGRLLAIAVLSAGYSQPTLTLFARELTANRATTINLFRMLRQREADVCGFCHGLLDQLRDAQAQAFRVLGSRSQGV